jgi:hypothetical protein
LQQACFAVQHGFTSATFLAAALLQHAALHLSQQLQVQDAGSQAHTPVTQQPQQSHSLAQAHALLPAFALENATAPSSAIVNTEPNRYFNMLQFLRKNTEIRNQQPCPKGGSAQQLSRVSSQELRTRSERFRKHSNPPDAVQFLQRNWRSE